MNRGRLTTWLLVGAVSIGGLTLFGTIGEFALLRNIWGLWQLNLEMDHDAEVARVRGPVVRQLAQACASCHGLDGNGRNDFYPRLAGQPAIYLERELEAFASGTRRHPIMESAALALTSEQRRELAAYFSRSPLIVDRPSIVNVGAAKALVQRCTSCHGKDLAGQRMELNGAQIATPRIAGQAQGYLLGQLQAYRSGERASPSNVMSGVSQSLSEEDMVALSAYLSSLP